MNALRAKLEQLAELAKRIAEHEQKATALNDELNALMYEIQTNYKEAGK